MISRIVIFNSNPDNPIEITSWGIQEHLIMLGNSENLSWDLSGFKLYESDGETLIRDCSDYTHRWDIYNQNENKVVYLTDLEDFTEPDPDTVEWTEWKDESPNLEKMESDIQYLSMMTGVDI